MSGFEIKKKYSFEDIFGRFGFLNNKVIKDNHKLSNQVPFFFFLKARPIYSAF